MQSRDDGVRAVGGIVGPKKRIKTICILERVPGRRHLDGKTLGGLVARDTRLTVRTHRGIKERVVVVKRCVRRQALHLARNVGL